MLGVGTIRGMLGGRSCRLVSRIIEFALLGELLKRCNMSIIRQGACEILGKPENPYFMVRA